jgi:hypothetical protein
LGNSEINEQRDETKADQRDGAERERLLARRAMEERASLALPEQPAASTCSNEELSHLRPKESIERIRSTAARLERDHEAGFSHATRGERSDKRDAAGDRYEAGEAERGPRQLHEMARLRAERETERLEEERHQDRHERNYHEMIEKTARGEIEFDAPQQAYVKVNDILSPERAGEWTKQDRPEFWNAHGNSEQFYRQMAEKYPEVKERIGLGETLEQLKTDEKIRVAAEFWYGKEHLVDLDKYQDSYFIGRGGHHRYLLGRKFRLGEIPAQVRAARPKTEPGD